MLKINQKVIAKFSKDMIMQLITGVYRKEETYSSYLYGTYREERCTSCTKKNTSNCSNCLLKYELSKDKKNNPDAILLTQETQKCAIKKQILSKKAILLYMAYYFCNIKQEGSDGVIAVVQESELKNLIKCCMATIYNLNEQLQQMGLIKYERIGKGLIRVVINNYSEQFKKNHMIIRYDTEYNDLPFYGGYINLTLDWFKKLIEVATTTNLVRLALFKTLTYDSHKANNLNRSSYTVEVLNRDYKEILTGALCNKEINDLTFCLQELFDDNIKHDVIDEFALKDEYVGNKVIAEFKSKCNKLFGNIFKTLTKKQHSDLEILSEQFGEDTIEYIINYLIEKQSETHESILANLGLIRTAIKKHIEYAFVKLTRKRIFSDTAVACTL